MITKMFKDEQILDIRFRVKIIKEINDKENVDRKRREAAKWEIWRDMIKPHVMKLLSSQGFKEETLKVFEARCTDINIFKKVVSKKARSYTKGVTRTVGDDKTATADLESLAKVTQLTKNMRRLDRYRQAARNAIAYIYPEKVEYVDDVSKEKSEKFTLCIKPLFPHLYDIIPDAADHEKPRCLIISPFTDSAAVPAMVSLNGGDGRNISQPLYQRDGYDQIIANAPRDSGANKREYIWWTATHHFTTDDKGQIIPTKSPTDNLNPAKVLPMVNFATDQDGEFWAQGGDDLVNGTKLVNLKLTDMESILHMQGWGQLVVTGQNIGKKEFQVGPQVALIMETGKEDQFPADAKLLSHDPQTDNHLKSTEVYVALLLTTNNLSVKSVAANLDASTMASGIAKMVDESEVMDDISEDQEYYGEKEKEVVYVLQAWAEAFKASNALIPKLKDLKPIPLDKISTKFHNQEQVITESEKLANIKLRKELGIDRMVDLIMADNPGMTEDEAMKRLVAILEEKQKLASLSAPGATDPEAGEEEDPAAPGEKNPSDNEPKDPAADPKPQG